MKLQILLVEDDDLQAAAIKGSLQQTGHRVTWVRAGAAALEEARQDPPELVLLDIRLPKMDGIEVARRLCRTRPLPVVLMTAYEKPSVLTRARLAGVYSFLNKPLDLAALPTTLEVACQNFRLIIGLEREVAGIKEELRNRKLVERAKGVLMDQMQVDSDEAEALLEAESQKVGLPVARMAEALLSLRPEPKRGQPPQRGRGLEARS
ncbi:MAG: response regulator [Deltaproteobacteria bacterium]|nr:response regulator [Deltaproteobacteria bacterium]